MSAGPPLGRRTGGLPGQHDSPHERRRWGVRQDGSVSVLFSPQHPELRSVLADAIELARAAVVGLGEGGVGEHLGVIAEDECAATHRFTAELPGYRGWQWAVVVAAAPGSDHVNISELVLLPGPDALIAPEWVPWNERGRPGDLAPGELLPPPPGDPRLVPGYVATGDPVVDETAWEVGLGRKQVMSREGRLDAAERWHDGEYGPDSEMAKAAPSRCRLCGFYLPLAGSLRSAFGVCGNEMAADGHVVHAEHGCGVADMRRLRRLCGGDRRGGGHRGERSDGECHRGERSDGECHRRVRYARRPRTRERGFDIDRLADRSGGDPVDPFGTVELRQATLLAWVASPTRLREDAAAESDLVRAGYRDRLLTELAQNAADAAVRGGVPGELRVWLDADVLHVANSGEPLDVAGVQALAALRASNKVQGVGRFGVGFTAVRSVSDEVELRST